jgi:hypothetical protein
MLEDRPDRHLGQEERDSVVCTVMEAAKGLRITTTLITPGKPQYSSVPTGRSLC